MCMYINEYTQYAALSFNAEDKKEQYADNPYISGELHRYIDRAAIHDELLSKFKSKHPEITNDRLQNICRFLCVRNLFFLNGINQLRRVYDDYDENNDWLLRAIETNLIWKEYLARKAIGLEQLVPDVETAHSYSLLVHFISDGSRDPVVHWKEKIGRGDL